MITIGFIEVNSIAKGIAVADIVLKTASVDLIYAKPSCPGKYQVLFAGEISTVEASMKAGCMFGEENIVDAIVIPRLDEQVIKAIHLAAVPEEPNAVGVMEFFNVTAAIFAADAAVKSADVQLMEVRLGTGIGGKSYVTLTGAVASVNEAVENGINHESTKGMLVGKVVIPNPHREIFENLI